MEKKQSMKIRMKMSDEVPIKIGYFVDDRVEEWEKWLNQELCVDNINSQQRKTG